MHMKLQDYEKVAKAQDVLAKIAVEENKVNTSKMSTRISTKCSRRANRLTTKIMFNNLNNQPLLPS